MLIRIVSFEASKYTIKRIFQSLSVFYCVVIEDELTKLEIETWACPFLFKIKSPSFYAFSWAGPKALPKPNPKWAAQKKTELKPTYKDRYQSGRISRGDQNHHQCFSFGTHIQSSKSILTESVRCGLSEVLHFLKMEENRTLSHRHWKRLSEAHNLLPSYAYKDHDSWHVNAQNIVHLIYYYYYFFHFWCEQGYRLVAT